jgi:hypothetical protein
LRIIECQQGSAEWLKHRLGVITGTRLGDAFKHSEALKNTLLAERMATYVLSDLSSRDMERGNALEPFAKKAYERKTGYKVQDVGFILHPDRDDIGLSPDGIIDNGLKAVEFKCPRSAKHIEYMRSTTAPTLYLFQLAAYFLCCPKLQSIDFVSYDELNEVKPLHILTLRLDDIFNIEYLKGRKMGCMASLESQVFNFADSINAEYHKLIF